MLSDRAMFLMLNPFYYHVETFRQPLLGQVPSGELWFGAIAMAVVSLLIGVVTFAVYRRRIAYWL